MNPLSSIKHYLRFKDSSLEEYKYLLDRSVILKAKFRSYETWHPLHDHTLAMIFEKNSTRTRLSFEVDIHQLGGHAVFLNTHDPQLGHGEPVEDVARVTSHMTDVTMTHTFGQEVIECFAAYSRVSVIDELTNEYRPCQVLADTFTLIEQRNSIRGKTVIWMGDANSTAYTWIQAVEILSFRSHFSAPKDYQLDPVVAAGSALPFVHVFENLLEARDDAHLVTMDVWTNMGYEIENEARKKAFDGWMVTETTMQRAQPDALSMHRLPVYRDEEVEAAIIDGRQSVVWDEAGDRLYMQKALMEYLLCGRYWAYSYPNLQV